MATVESIHASLKIDTKDFIRGIKDAFGTANKEANSFRDSTEKVKDNFDNVTKAAKQTKEETKKLGKEISDLPTQKPKELTDIFRNLGTSLGIGILAKNIVDVGGSFEATMSKVKAATGATKQDLAKLETVAKDLGSTTTFSASEAASAMVELGKAGLSTQQIIEGTKDVLSLATVGELSLAEAATIAADTMSQLNLTATDTGRIADVMAKAANSSTISVREMAETFKMAAPNAAMLGVSIENLSAMTAILGSAGIKSSTAGEKLRSIFSRLSDPTKEASNLLKQYNIEVSNSNGSMKSMSEIFGQMKNKLEGLGDVPKAKILSAIFGMENVAAGLALIKSGKEGIDDMTESLKNSAGYSKQFADIANDNFVGTLKSMQSALEGVVLVLWEEMKPALTLMVQGITSLLSGIIEFAKENPALTKTILQATLAMVGLVAIITGASGLITAMNTMGIGIMAANVKVALFGTTLQREALAAKAKWLAILGPFALAAGLTAITLTLTYNIIERRQQEKVESAGNMGTIAGVQTALANKDEAEYLLSNLNKHKNAIRAATGDTKKYNEAIDALDNRLGSLKVSLKNVSRDYLGIGPRNQDEINAIFNNFEKGLTSIIKSSTQVQAAAKPAAAGIRSIGNSAASTNKDLTDVITTGKLLENQFDKQVSFKAEVDVINIDNSKKEIEELSKKYKELGYEFKALGFKPDSDGKQKLEFELTATTSNTVNQTDVLLRNTKNTLGNINKEVKFLSVNNKDSFNKKYPNEFYDSLVNIGEILSDIGKSDSFGQKFISSLEIAKQSVQSIGNQFTKLLQSQANFAQAKQQNFSQNLRFMTDGLVQFLDNQTNSQLSAIESEIQAIIDKQNEIERLEKQHQERMQEIIDSYRAQRSQELDNEFNLEVQRMNEEFRIKQESLIANTSSQAEQAAIIESIENDRLNSIENLRAQFDERLRMDTENKRKQEEEKLKADKEKNSKNNENDLLTLEQLNAKKEELTRKSELEKNRVKKMSALIEWQAGKAAFEANKRSQIAQAQISMMSTILSGVQAWAMLTAQTGVLGLVSGAAFLATITGLALGAGSMAISTAQAQQYPPPPIFMSEGGTVPGVGNTDSVPAMLTPGELVVDKSTTNQLQENLKNGGMGTMNITLNNYIQGSNSEQIADEISTILFDRIERRFMNV